MHRRCSVRLASKRTTMMIASTALRAKLVVVATGAETVPPTNCPMKTVEHAVSVNQVMR